MPKERITIAVGPAGEWASAFAKVAAERNHHVRLFFHNPTDLVFFEQTHQTPKLKDVTMPNNVKAFTDIKQWTDGAELVVLGPPSIYFREFWNSVKTSIKPDTSILLLTKGLERETHLRMSEIILEKDPSRIDYVAVLSGPNQAKEVAKGELAGAVVAAHNPNTVNLIQTRLNSDQFCVYTSDDVAGVEYGAAFKNVAALGAGMVDAFQVAHSTKAFYLTRALEEIAALGITLSAHDSTFRGLAGYGDLSLSCYGGNTRNYRAGLRIVQGWPIHKILDEELVEGYYTLKTAMDLVRNKDDYPIISTLYGIWYEGVPIRGDINQLLGRQPTKEQSADKGLGFKSRNIMRRWLHNLGLRNSGNHIRS